MYVIVSIRTIEIKSCVWKKKKEKGRQTHKGSLHVLVEEVMNIIIFYKKKIKKDTLVANCNKGMEEASIVAASLVVFSL